MVHGRAKSDSHHNWRMEWTQLNSEQRSSEFSCVPIVFGTVSAMRGLIAYVAIGGGAGELDLALSQGF
jgi:hypothetical protein